MSFIESIIDRSQSFNTNQTNTATIREIKYCRTRQRLQVYNPYSDDELINKRTHKRLIWSIWKALNYAKRRGKNSISGKTIGSGNRLNMYFFFFGREIKHVLIPWYMVQIPRKTKTPLIRRWRKS
jgi:hypothetical protein